MRCRVEWRCWTTCSCRPSIKRGTDKISKGPQKEGWLSLVDCYLSIAEWIRSTPGGIAEVIPSHGGRCLWCRLDWWCRTTQSCQHKTLSSRQEPEIIDKDSPRILRLGVGSSTLPTPATPAPLSPCSSTVSSLHGWQPRLEEGSPPANVVFLGENLIYLVTNRNI